MSGENYRSATKSHDPGWNDPPKLSYSPGAASGQSTKLNLNKRVAFPLTKQPPPNQPLLSDGSLPKFVPTAPIGMAGTPPMPNASVGSLPPMMVGTPPKTTEIRRTSVSSNQDEPVSYPEEEEMISFVKTTLDDFVLKLDTSKQADIRKRLDIIQRSWTDCKFGDALIKKLYRLAKELADGRATEANAIHRSLIVDHGSECVQWAPALRQLILLVPKQQDPEADADSSIPNPI